MKAPLRVLLIEDSESDARLIRELLASEERLPMPEFALEHVSTLSEGLVSVSAFPPAVMLLDLSLPDSERLNTFRVIHFRAPSIPVVVMTVLEDQDMAISAVGEGAQDYLVKGQVSGHQLTQALRYAMERQRLLLDLRRAKEEAESRSVKLTGDYRQLETALDRLREVVDRERSSLRRMEELDQLKNEFMAIFAHDLRGTTHVVKSVAELLVKRWDSLSDSKRRSYAGTLLRSSGSLARLIENVLEYARMEQGSVQVERHPFDLHRLVKATVEEQTGPEGMARITLTAPPRLPLALGDEGKLWQVLTNLLGNAQKFSLPEAPIQVELRHQEREGRLEVRVRDEGRGVAAEDMPKLFQKFSRVGVSGNSAGRVPGTGLGLYICKRLLEVQGGAIWAESRLGEGSTFIFSIPVAGAEASEALLPGGN